MTTKASVPLHDERQTKQPLKTTLRMRSNATMRERTRGNAIQRDGMRLYAREREHARFQPAQPKNRACSREK